MIFSAFFSALGQLGDRRFRSTLFKGVGLTILLLFGFYLVFSFGVGWLVGDSVTLPWIGEVTWVDNAISWAAIPLTILLSVFLMVPVASAITSLFLDDVADAVEEKHYPHLPPAEPLSFSEGLRDTLSFLGILIGANLAALVLYLFLSPLAPVIFWVLNGFLLGREYFTLAATRRVGRIEAKALWRRNLLTISAAGALMAVPLTVPLVNLLIPVLGAATFTHIFHRLAR
ncbi:EI24 domain-containing protein [Pacificoceanicola onchidii]|uniref:EI24 domain-containing protein n=1 Tax=Pacificoceanicola onchidii TaxID=2562685 RepID=UPI0010A549DD|nr:EI24 domain-containing protein [Pacificoceanicola onchidii]